MSRTRRSHRPPTSDTKLARENAKKRKVRKREDRKRAREISEMGQAAMKSCGSKFRFGTVQAAMEHADRVRALYGSGGMVQSAYRCSLCGGWHLTSHPRGNV